MSEQDINLALKFVNENQEYFTGILNGNIEIDFETYKLNDDINFRISDMLKENNAQLYNDKKTFAGFLSATKNRQTKSKDSDAHKKIDRHNFAK